MRRREPRARRPRAGAASRDVLRYCRLPFRVNMSFEILEVQVWGCPNTASIARVFSARQSGGAPTFGRSSARGVGSALPSLPILQSGLPLGEIVPYPADRFVALDRHDRTSITTGIVRLVARSNSAN